VQYNKQEGYYIRFKQQKTDRPVSPTLRKRLNSWGTKNGTWENLLNLKKWDLTV
jgi:hypothetical protein